MKEKSLAFILNSGKNRKFPYYLRNMIRHRLEPTWWFRARRERLLRSVASRPDRDYIADRVAYYCKLTGMNPLPESATRVGDFKRGKEASVYFYDTYEYLRYFPQEKHCCFTFGDIIDLQPHPSIVKSRPLGDDNQNSVVMKLDKVRHFIFLKDRKPFTAKEPRAVFRGKVVGKASRIAFLEKFANDPLFDVGEVGRRIHNPALCKPMLTLYDHLNYQFVMALEGNDVASNLKWIMSSNSLAVMPPPTCETWFMEGRLVADYHYIAVKPDYSNLKEKLHYYTTHPEEAQRIIENAHAWVEQFRNKKREKLISLLVLDAYFCATTHE